MPVNFYIMQPSSQFLSQYKTFQDSRIKPEDYVKRYSTELGVDDARTRVKTANAAIRSTEGTIAGVPDSVAGRTSGSLVNDSQRNRLVQNEVNPLADILTTQNKDFNEATTDANTLTNDVDRRTALALQGDDSNANSLLTLYQAAFDQEKQQESVRQFNESQAEARRQYEESKAAAAQAARATFGGGGDATPAAPGSSGMAVWQNKGADNQFKDSTGKPISAFEYSILNGVEYRKLLSVMAQKGDKNAQLALKYVGNDGQFGNADATARAALQAVGAKGSYKAAPAATYKDLGAGAAMSMLADYNNKNGTNYK